MREEAEVARDLAREAGELAAELQGKVAVREKGGGRGPVTEADLRLEEMILEGLHETFPDDPVLSEETRPRAALPTRRLWCVDPIDGTHEYAHGVPEYTVQIGLLVDHVPVAGALAVPGRDQLLWGFEGGGAFLAEDGETRRLALAPLTEVDRAVAVHSRRHLSADLRDALDRLGVARTMPTGGVGYKVVRILLGEAHLYLHTGRGTKWWDSVAPAAILLAAGGTVTAATGAALDYRDDVRHRDGLLFAVPDLLDATLARLAETDPRA